ncbi:hypothetical protein TH61_10115 [Rufibacter sp. DG15C]|uniref:hypothetical protein n=1 Tax=Rufibacter sp. DG15C TaxID=1379909 RepID=UPI00078D01DD|nr:hypothetical protein [Rufibacter sp. DG15C]AMM51458.1 hypothetical protein TH61_10115 [Rufibacter sp. DG15C]
MKVIEKLSKYRLLAITISLLTAAFLIESPFAHLHYEEPRYSFYFLIIFINTILYLLPVQKIVTAEKIIYGLLIAFFSMLGGIFFTDATLGVLYGYDDYYGLLESPDLLESIIFYFTSILLSTGIFYLILKHKATY